jgi:hypothetical protein
MRIARAGISHRDGPQQHCIKITFDEVSVHLQPWQAQAILDVMQCSIAEVMHGKRYDDTDLKNNQVTAMWSNDRTFILYLHTFPVYSVTWEDMNPPSVTEENYTPKEDQLIWELRTACARARLNQQDNPLHVED